MSQYVIVYRRIHTAWFNTIKVRVWSFTVLLLWVWCVSVTEGFECSAAFSRSRAMCGETSTSGQISFMKPVELCVPMWRWININEICCCYCGCCLSDKVERLSRKRLTMLARSILSLYALWCMCKGWNTFYDVNCSICASFKLSGSSTGTDDSSI